MVSGIETGLTGPDGTVFSKQKLPEGLSRSDILALDRLAVAAWPAPETVECHGWLLRHADGVTRRANSTAPFPPAPGIALDRLLDDTARFYRARGLPPRVQVSPAAAPEGLDDLLAQRGYERESGVTIMIAPAASLCEADESVDISPHAPAGWWDAYMEGYGRDPRAIADGAGEVPAYASISGADGNILALGFGVLGGCQGHPWLAVFGMWTRPEMRQRGLGGRIIRALTAFAVDRGAIGVYLQVEDDNPTARRLYEKLGFRGVYGYHYRTLWTAL